MQCIIVTCIISAAGQPIASLYNEQRKPGWWPVNEASVVMCTCLQQKLTKSIPRQYKNLKGKAGGEQLLKKGNYCKAMHGGY